ncbi:MAG: hypothetical protein AAB784_02280 [Patescibacteria group bacterium]
MNTYKKQAIKLRRLGKTYSEIISVLPKVSKSTLSNWLAHLKLSTNQKEKLSKNINKKLNRARAQAAILQSKKRKEYFSDIENKNAHLIKILRTDIKAAKLVLSALHLGEGSKNRQGSMQLGNSDPGIIKLFLKLMRACYEIDESKFRCTILCRADQNYRKLENFWKLVTGIPKKQFYKTRVDPRTIGKPSRKLDYKGVCVINYLSASVYYDLLTLGKMMST